MKIKVNQIIFSADGKTPLKEDGIIILLKHICINAMLTPIQDAFNEKGQIIRLGDTMEMKLEKYKVYELLLALKGDEIDLTINQIKLLKDTIGLIQPQMILGQCFKMLPE